MSVGQIWFVQTASALVLLPEVYPIVLPEIVFYECPTMVSLPFVKHQIKTSAHAYLGVAYHVNQQWNCMNAHPYGRPIIFKTRCCIGFVTNQFSYLSPEFQLPNFLGVIMSLFALCLLYTAGNAELLVCLSL